MVLNRRQAIIWSNDDLVYRGIYALLDLNVLTHWGQAMHICISKIIIIGSDNGLSPGRRQAIIWTDAWMLLIGPLGTNFNEIDSKFIYFHSRKSISICRLKNGGHFVSASMCSIGVMNEGAFARLRIDMSFGAIPYIAATTCWRHQMETYSELLTICAGNSSVPGEFPVQRPVTRSFDVFFDLRLNKRLSKQSWGWWFETLSQALWRQCNAPVNVRISFLRQTNMNSRHGKTYKRNASGWNYY